MLISAAYAAGTATTTAVATTGDTGTTWPAIAQTGMLIVILTGLFYFMMIVPQQKRFRRHRDMLNALRKGDNIITSGGLIGTIDKAKDGEDEVVIDLGNGIKVTALRSTIQQRHDSVKAKTAK